MAKGLLDATLDMKPFVKQSWNRKQGSAMKVFFVFWKKAGGESVDVLANLSFEADGTFAETFTAEGTDLAKTVGKWLLQGNEAVLTYGDEVELSAQAQSALASGLFLTTMVPVAKTVVRYTAAQLEQLHTECTSPT